MKRIVYIFAVAMVLCGCRPPAPAAALAPARWEFCQVNLESADSIFRTAIEVSPGDVKNPVRDAADVLNLASKNGWQEVWISGDGRKVLVKRPDTGSGASSLIVTTVPK